MTPEIVLVLGIILAAVVLFATEKLRVDVIALLVLLTVALTGLVSPEEAFSGFASPAVITVWAVYIVSGGLFRTGVADMLGARVIRLAGNSEPRLIAVIILAERGFEGFAFFDFTPMGAIVFATGILYMVLAGSRLLPVRPTAEEQQTQQLREYISEVRVPTESPLVGKTLADSRLGSDYDLSVLAILREGQLLTAWD